MTRAKYDALKEAEKKAHATLVQVTKLNARRELVKGLTRMERVLLRLPSIPLSADNKTALLSAYNRGSVRDGLVKVVDIGIEKSVKIAINPVLAYVGGSFKDAGIDTDITPAFDNLEKRLVKKLKVFNFRAVKVIENRTGFNLSPSIWDAVDGFSDRILAIIEAELEAGTDPVKIARMLEEYIAAGTPEKVLGRWGKLEIGTPEYRKRLGTSGADYRTQRVVRTEMYNAIRTADIEAGAMNPASTGMFNWMLSPSHIDSGCDCPERAAGSPYTKKRIDELQASSHVNDMCLVSPVLMDHDEFMKGLEDYAQGRDTEDGNRIADWMADQDLDTA